jgi:hypothetical protein
MTTQVVSTCACTPNFIFESTQQILLGRWRVYNSSQVELILANVCIQCNSCSHKIVVWSHTNLQSCKKPQLQTELRVWFCNWFFEAVYSDEVNPLLTYFTDEEQLYLSFHVDIQCWHTIYGSAHDSSLIHEVPLHDIAVQCAIKILIRSNRYTGQIIIPFFKNLSDQKKEWRFLQQDGATTHSQ